MTPTNPWINSQERNPAKKGVFRVKDDSLRPNYGYRYWDGKAWSAKTKNQKDAEILRPAIGQQLHNVVWFDESVDRLPTKPEACDQAWIESKGLPARERCDFFFAEGIKYAQLAEKFGSKAVRKSGKTEQPVKAKPEAAKPAKAVKAKPEAAKPAKAVKAKPEAAKPAKAVKAKPEAAKPAKAVKAKPEAAKPAKAVKAKPEAAKPAKAVRAEPVDAFAPKSGNALDQLDEEF